MHPPRQSEIAWQQRMYQIGPIITYVKYRLMKTSSIDAAIQYGILLTLLFLGAYTFADNENYAKVSNVIATQSFNGEQFVEIRTLPQWFDWLRKCLQIQHDLAQGETFSSRRAIYGMLVSQYRVRSSLCHDGDLAKADDGAGLIIAAGRPGWGQAAPERLCFPGSFSPPEAQRQAPAPLGIINGTLSTVAAAAASLRTAHVAWNFSEAFSSSTSHLQRINPRNGLCRSMHYGVQNDEPYYCRDASSVFSIDLRSINEVATATAILQDIDELEQQAWVAPNRGPVRALVVEAIFWHDYVQRFLRVTATLEVSDGASVFPLVQTTNFNIPRMPSMNMPSTAEKRDMARFVTDVLVSICGLYVLGGFLYRLALSYEANSRISTTIDFALVLDIVTISAVATLLALRFMNLASSLSVFPLSGNTTRQEALLLLFSQAETSFVQQTFESWMLLIVSFRFLLTLQHNNRLSLVYETVAASVTDLISVAIVSIIVLFAYTLMGMIIWHHTNTPFKSFGRALFMLFNVMISLNIDNYETYAAVNEVSTLLFWFTFFIISWCVLMNIMVGVLATAFAQALTTQTVVKRPAWDWNSLSTDFSVMWQRWRGYDPDPSAATPGKDLAVRKPLVAPTLKWPLRLATCCTGMTPTALRTIAFLQMLRKIKEREGGAAKLSGHQIEEMSTFASTETARMLAKAELHVGISDANRRRWLMMQKLIASEKDVSAQLSIQFRQLQALVEIICGDFIHAKSGEAGGDEDEDDLDNLDDEDPDDDPDIIGNPQLEDQDIDEEEYEDDDLEAEIQSNEGELGHREGSHLATLAPQRSNELEKSESGAASHHQEGIADDRRAEMRGLVQSSQDLLRRAQVATMQADPRHHATAKLLATEMDAILLRYEQLALALGIVM